MAAYKRFVFAGDVHGSEQDPAANRAFFKFVEQWKPEYRICSGDLFDFSPLRKKADEYERRQSMSDDFQAGKLWLEKLKATHYLRGNHCERLYLLGDRGDGVMRDYALGAIEEVRKLTTSLKCRVFPYDKREGVLRLGHLKMIHGYAHGVSAARRLAMVYGAVLAGHAHSIQHVSIEGIDHRMGRIVGCLCNLDLQYARTTLGALMWRHGWAYGVVNERTGDYFVWQAEEVNGMWMLPSDIVGIKG